MTGYLRLYSHGYRIVYDALPLFRSIPFVDVIGQYILIFPLGDAFGLGWLDRFTHPNKTRRARLSGLDRRLALQRWRTHSLGALLSHGLGPAGLLETPYI